MLKLLGAWSITTLFRAAVAAVLGGKRRFSLCFSGLGARIGFRGHRRGGCRGHRGRSLALGASPEPPPDGEQSNRNWVEGVLNATSLSVIKALRMSERQLKALFGQGKSSEPDLKEVLLENQGPDGAELPADGTVGDWVSNAAQSVMTSWKVAVLGDGETKKLQEDARRRSSLEDKLRASVMSPWGSPRFDAFDEKVGASQSFEPDPRPGTLYSTIRAVLGKPVSTSSGAASEGASTSVDTRGGKQSTDGGPNAPPKLDVENANGILSAPPPAPPPEVPGLDDANLVVRVKIEPKRVEAVETQREGVARLMAEPGGNILALMAQDGWEVKQLDPITGTYELSLPSVRYQFALGVVSIPSPRFVATVRDTFTMAGSYEERLQGDLVLQNGQDILTVDVGFPFKSTFSVSAAGWTRCCIGSDGEFIGVSNDIVLGLKVPRVPGLESAMELFVKSYGGESTLEVARALARGADNLPVENGWWQSTQNALRGFGMPGTTEVNDEIAEDGPEAEAALVEEAPNKREVVDGPVEATPTYREAIAVQDEAESPFVPGMEDANLVVRIEIDPKRAEAVQSKREGVARLMGKSGGRILETMAQDGWTVTPLNPDQGTYEITLPAVSYTFPLGAVSIPAPRFIATVRDTFTKMGLYQERLVGDQYCRTAKIF